MATRDHCRYCNDTGKFYEKDDKNFRGAVGWIPCPHCINGKYRMGEQPRKMKCSPMTK